MTMAVGFLCRDGVVIGADRQVTGSNYTFPECKLSSVKWGNGHGIFAYSGNRDTWQDFCKELMARFHLTAIIQHEEVKGLLTECLKLSLHKKEAFFTLFGFCVDGSRQSLLMSSTSTQRIVDVTECEVIGYGDSPLARFLLGTFRDLPGSVTVHQARLYAVYFISQAKKYDGQYVGDGIDVYSIDHSGDAGQRCVRVLDAGQTGAWETQTNLMHYWMNILFHRAVNKDTELFVGDFMRKLEDFRDWAVGKKKEDSQ